MRLRKPTKAYRSTLSAIPTFVVEAELDASASAVKRVTLHIHEEHAIEYAFDCNPSSIDARDAYWISPVLGHNLCFTMFAHQSLVARATGELHELGVLVEYLEGDDG